MTRVLSMWKKDRGCDGGIRHAFTRDFEQARDMVVRVDPSNQKLPLSFPEALLEAIERHGMESCVHPGDDGGFMILREQFCRLTHSIRRHARVRRRTRCGICGCIYLGWTLPIIVETRNEAWQRHLARSRSQ